MSDSSICFLPSSGRIQFVLTWSQLCETQMPPSVLLLGTLESIQPLIPLLSYDSLISPKAALFSFKSTATDLKLFQSAVQVNQVI